MVTGLETASDDSWHYMVKEEEGREECVPFRMLNPACGSGLCFSPCFHILQLCIRCSLLKEKEINFPDQYSLGSLTLDSLSHTLKFKSLTKRFSLVALKLGSLESETYRMCAMGREKKSINLSLKELQRFRLVAEHV